MRTPASSTDWFEFEEVTSTQDVAGEFLASGTPVSLVFAHHQTGGRGRRGRIWHSRKGDSLTVSMVFNEYADHPKPHLIGMSVGVAAATALGLQIRWPNDLVAGARKVGGILTELLPDAHGRKVPVVGLGINLNQDEFPDEISSIACSLRQAFGKVYDSEQVLKNVLSQLRLLPEPTEWTALEPHWKPLDVTPGKIYRTAGGQSAIANAVGPSGELLCHIDGKAGSILAAEAIFT